MPRKSSASRSRTRRIGLLGLLLTTLLTPAGIIVGTVTAAALIGGAFQLNRTASEETVSPPRPLSGKAGSLQHLSIERDGKPVTLVMAEDEIGTGGGVGSFDPTSPLFAGLAGNGPAQPGTPVGMPSGRSPGTSLPGDGSGPDSGGPPGAKPPATPSVPPVAGGPHTPTGKGADETSNEEGAPDKPDETRFVPPPEINSQPNPGNQPPGNGLPQDTLPGPNTLPGLPSPPLSGPSLDTQTQPPGTQRGTQPNAVPEPSMLGLMLLGMAALVWSGRRRPDSLSPA